MNRNTRDLIGTAKAITIVSMIDKKYTVAGIILCFFFISLQCPFGVDRKQVPAILIICEMENMMA